MGKGRFNEKLSPYAEKHERGNSYESKMSNAGYVQGDMSPHVDNIQTPSHDFAESGFSKTTQYIERQDAFRGKEANHLRKQAYMGRYS